MSEDTFPTWMVTTVPLVNTWLVFIAPGRRKKVRRKQRTFWNNLSTKPLSIVEVKMKKHKTFKTKRYLKAHSVKNGPHFTSGQTIFDYIKYKPRRDVPHPLLVLVLYPRKIRFRFHLEIQCNTPGTRDWSRLRDRTLALPKTRANISFFFVKKKSKSR